MTRFGNEGSPRPVPKGVIELVKAAPATAGLSSDRARRESLRSLVGRLPTDHFMGLHAFIGHAS